MSVKRYHHQVPADESLATAANTLPMAAVSDPL